MSKRTTIQDVAKSAKVSVASVSLYLNNKPGLAEATRERIAASIKTLGYIPRRQNGQSFESSMIGLIVERLPFSMFSDLHYGEVLHSMESKARELGHHLSLIVIERDQPFDQLSERLQGVSGIIILGAGDVTKAVAKHVIAQQRPVLLVDTHYPDMQFNCVLVDNSEGAQQATKHLLDKGYKKIACIQGSAKYPSLVERFQGYCNALINANIQVNPSLIQAPISSGYPNKGYREMKALLERNESFDAVFCVSDRTALGALQALQEDNLKIPEDVALVGFEDVPQAKHTSPPLTTVKMPKTALGERAIQQLHNTINGEKSKEPIKSVLYTSLVVRSST